jgi:hypothetical protein
MFSITYSLSTPPVVKVGLDKAISSDFASGDIQMVADL